MTRKIVIFICCLIVFIGATGGSFWYVKNSYNNDSENIITEDKEDGKKVITKNEHIVETNRFLTDWEFDRSIVEAFPHDNRYRMTPDFNLRLMYNVIDNEEVYKEYAERMNGNLPKEVDFNKNFVILITAEESKDGPKEDLEISDITHTEDDSTMNIVLKPKENPAEYAYMFHNAWYAIVNDKSLLRGVIKVIIED